MAISRIEMDDGGGCGCKDGDDDGDGTNSDLVRWCVAADAVVVGSGSGSGSTVGFGPSSGSVTGSAEPGGGTWDSPRICPLCTRVYSNNSNLRRHLRSAHATATDLLELTSLQRRPAPSAAVKILSIDHQVQRASFSNHLLSNNLDDFGESISDNPLSVHSNTSTGCEDNLVQFGSVYNVSFEPT